MSPASRRRLAASLALLCVCALSWLHPAYHDFENDDAYISYRYARNWARGAGPVFNPGERVEGYSNFLLVAALAAVERAGGDVVSASRGLGTLAAWGLALAVYFMLAARLRRGVALALAGSLAVALHAALATWARSGMETLPLACLVAVGQLVFLRELEREGRHWISGLVFGGVSLLRADGFVHAAATLLFLALSRSRRRAWTFAVAFLLVFAPYVLWRLEYYGQPFPNPYFLRTGGGYYQLLRGLFDAYNFVVPFGGLLLFAAPLLLFVLRDPERDRTRAYLATCSAVFTAYIIWVGGDYMPMGRFFVPLVAGLIVLQLETVVELTRRLEGAAAQRAVRLFLAACVVVSGFLPTSNRRRPPQNRAIVARAQVQQWTSAGRWLRQHVPSGTWLAAEPVGALGWYSELPIVDMLGVNDAHIAHLPSARLGRSTAGHEKRDFDYVLSRRPALIFRGVWTWCEHEGATFRQPDGSFYTRRCVPLGEGPMANDFGEVQWGELFLWYDERNPAEP